MRVCLIFVTSSNKIKPNNDTLQKDGNRNNDEYYGYEDFKNASRFEDEYSSSNRDGNSNPGSRSRFYNQQHGIIMPENVCFSFLAMFASNLG